MSKTCLRLTVNALAARKGGLIALLLLLWGRVVAVVGLRHAGGCLLYLDELDASRRDLLAAEWEYQSVLMMMRFPLRE